MNAQQLLILSKDLAKAVSEVLGKHDVNSDIYISFDMAGNANINLKKAIPPQTSAVVTANAIHRYLSSRGKLGLPARGTTVEYEGKEYEIAGLSTDGKRIKATSTGSIDVGQPSIDIKLESVLEALKQQAQMKEAELAAKDEVSDTQDAAIVLANLMKKP